MILFIFFHIDCSDNLSSSSFHFQLGMKVLFLISYFASSNFELTRFNCSLFCVISIYNPTYDQTPHNFKKNVCFYSLSTVKMRSLNRQK